MRADPFEKGLALGRRDEADDALAALENEGANNLLGDLRANGEEDGFGSIDDGLVVRGNLHVPEFGGEGARGLRIAGLFNQTPPRQLAQTLGLLPQTPIALEGITVVDLVSRGRHPHHGMLSRWTRRDDEAVAAALEATRTVDLAERPVDELSGGQRQRV